MLRNEEARLRRTFQRLLLLSLASCGSEGVHSEPGSDAGVDATTTKQDGGPIEQDPVDATIADAGVDARKRHDAGPYVCSAGPIVEVDGGEDAGKCGDYFERLLCGLPSDISPTDCYLNLIDCARFCQKDGGYFSCHVTDGCIDGDGDGGLATVVDGGPITIECARCTAGGRRPAGLVRASFSPAASALGDYFARAAHLEAASVDAFRTLRRELVLFGAPRTLVRAAAKSARDEVRHARVTARLARRHGGSPVAPRVSRPARAKRSLEEVALENMVEGCVRETFGALVASHQASRATDATIAAVMERIAQDETRHAALSWAVARFLDTRLDVAARDRVDHARRAAIAALRSEIDFEPAAPLADAAGLPRASRSRMLFDGMTHALWG